MRRIGQIRAAIAITALAFSLGACTAPVEKETSRSASSVVGSTVFPYHPLVYHMDLSILAYQIYGQSLVWPFDPYYEERDAQALARDTLIAKIQRWARSKGAEQVARRPGLASYRGPGSLNGFADNATHDPILYNYSLVHPWSNTLTNANGTWTEYLTPKSITGQIRQVNVCYRPTGASADSVAMGTVANRSGTRARDAQNSLWIFEGGTGDKGEAGQPASQSLMGFILLRNKPGGSYDVHIAFRGSRSGSPGRAIKEGLSDRLANGNPDWITDLGYNRLISEEGGALISTVGQVHRGFAKSMSSILPNLMHCLANASKQKRGVRPDSIYVTGHSLGGALAQHFVSAMLMGNRYGPLGKGAAMPASVKAWPWTDIKLITYGAPRSGDVDFARELTVKMLQSDQFSTALSPIDLRALKPSDPSILPRLLDHDRPVGFRVLNSKDPVTTQKIIGGKHVGKTVYVNRPQVFDIVSPPDFSAHEQRRIRDELIVSLGDARIPPLAMRYRTMDEINPSWNAQDRGSRNEMQKLANALTNYYSSTGTWFDRTAFQRNVALRFRIADQP